MITPAVMVQIIKSRRLQLIPIAESQSDTIGWVTRTIDGSRAGGNSKPYPTPEEAVEAAEVWLSQAEVRANERKSNKVVSALEKGRYYIRSREISTPDEEGKPIKKIVFSAFLPNGSATTVIDLSSFTDAVLTMEEVLK